MLGGVARRLASLLLPSVNNLILGPKPLREMNYVSPSFVSATRPKAAVVRVFLATNDGRGERKHKS